MNALVEKGFGSVSSVLEPNLSVKTLDIWFLANKTKRRKN